jgi:hypothetical protein
MYFYILNTYQMLMLNLKGASMRVSYFKVLLTVMISFTTTSAMACQDGYYSDSFGICWPYDQTIGKQAEENLDVKKQIGRVIALGDAILSGDRDRMASALGDAVLNAPGCIGCSALTTTVLQKLSKDQINKIVGEGFLTFVATGNPTLVVIDVAQKIIRESQITPPAENPFGKQPPPVSRKYTGKANCIMQEKNGDGVMAAWISNPELTGEDGAVYKYPTLEISLGDNVKLTAPLCTQYNNNNQTSITSVNLKYKYSNTIPGGEQQIKYIFYGEVMK